MRIGQNPARLDQPAYQPNRVGIAALVYIPHLSGYFEQSLAVFELMLDSILTHTPRPFDLCVFDNGSCAEVKQALAAWQAAGKIDWLVSSTHNMGKTGALNWLFGGMPNELIVYADSDVYFRPGWLEESLNILAGFPAAGMICAQPNFYDIFQGAAKAPARLDPSFTRFDYAPERTLIAEYVRSLGHGDETFERYASAPLPAVRSPLNGAEAVIGSSHMQFLIPRAAAQAALPLPATRALQPLEDQVLDHCVDDAGLLHLSTLRALVLHMGNVYDPALRAGLNGSRPPAPASAAPRRKSALLTRIARSYRLRPLIQRLYKALYELVSA